jgi:hypothetical protein
LWYNLKKNKKTKMSKKQKWYLAFIVILFLATATVLFVVSSQDENSAAENVPLTNNEIGQPISNNRRTTNQDIQQTEYSNEKYGFSFEYPDNYCLAEEEKPDGLFIMEIHSSCPIPSDWEIFELSPHSFEYLKNDSYGVIMAENKDSELGNYVGAHVSKTEHEMVQSSDGKVGYKFNSACVFDTMNNHTKCSDKENVWHFKNNKTNYIFTFRGNKEIMNEIISTLQLPE